MVEPLIQKVVYFENLTKQEHKIFKILEQYDKQFSEHNAIDFLFIIGKGSYEKSDNPLFNDWETIDYHFSEGDVNFVTQLINEYPKKSTIVEMGVWKGWSTSQIVPKLKKEQNYVCIDWFKGSPTESCEGADPEVVKTLFWKRMKETGIENKISLREGDSIEVSKTFEDESIDLFFLDGAHTEPYFSNDIKAWNTKIKVGGIFSGHDWSQVGKTAKMFFIEENGYEKVEIKNEEIGKNDCWAYKKIRKVDIK